MTPRPTPPPGGDAPRPPRPATPEAATPEATAPAATAPKAPKPRAAKPKTVKPEVAQPEEAQPGAAKPKAVKPEVAKPKTARPKAVKPDAAKPRAARPKTAKPKVLKPAALQPELTEADAAQPGTDAPRPEVAQPSVAKPRAARTTRVVQPKAARPVRAAAGPRSPQARPAPPLGGEDRARLLAGTHHDPHGVLGAHPAPAPAAALSSGTPGSSLAPVSPVSADSGDSGDSGDSAATVADGVLLRVLRPYAKAVTVLADGVRAQLFDEGDGLFGGVLPLAEVPAYRLLITYDDNEITVDDPYRFLPSLGDLDLHLIGEGRHEELWRALGAEPMSHQGVPGTRFSVWAPNALGVRVVGDFNYWDGTGCPMRSLGGTGVWELFLPEVGEGALYKFQITRPDGSHTMRADPMARQAEVPPANASVVSATHHEWQDAAWMASRADRPVHEAPLSVYEVHLPSWRPGLTYRQLAEQLPTYVSDLGFTHVELMPVAEHPFGGSWGYQVTGFYAPTSRMGTPDDFRFLIDALHRAGIGVIMDWVPAHFPRDDWALAEFDGRPLYEHEDPLKSAHPDWGTLEFDYGRTEVRNFLVANATYWCEEFHIDGLRVDAVASMLYLDYSREAGQWVPNEHGGRENLDAVAFLQEMNATVYRRNPGVVTIAEESTAWDGVTRATHHTGPGGFGGLGFGLKWNMGWMHDSLDYVAKEPVHRKYHHHEMTFSMVYAYSENYVLPISHDEVVHGKRALVSKMPGDWWQQRATHRAYLGFMWAHPGKQLLFMGQEFAQGAEWSEAHGPDWWLLDPSYGAEADHRGVRDLVRDLNAGYRDTPALWERDTVPEGFAWVDGDAAEDNVFAFLRYDAAGSPLLAVSHFSPVVREDYRIGVPDDAPAWTEVLNTDAEGYGGSGVRNPEPLKPESVPHHGRPASIRLTLPPLATVWLRPA